MRTVRTPLSPHAFDPVAVGELECAAWAAYYRREWPRFLRKSVGMVRAAFGMRWDHTVRGAWYVLRANQLWAPAENSPQAAEQLMERFYALAVRAGRLQCDPRAAAILEVGWWQVHRQRDGPASTAALVDQVTALYDCVFRAPAAATRRASELRVLAMDLSDEWVAAGRDRASPLLVAERAALVDSYTALRGFRDDQLA